MARGERKEEQPSAAHASRAPQPRGDSGTSALGALLDPVLGPAPSDALMGRALGGRLVIEERIGSGACGVVYRARHLHLALSVAVKVLHPSLQLDAGVRARFHAEGRAASLLDHPNLVRVLDFGEERDGTLWLAMELLEGTDLSHLLERTHRLRVEHAAELMLQITAGLAHAHSHRIVHGDVKPSNVILVRRTDDDGEEHEHVKLCDFGVVRGIAEAGASMLLGTPTYMSPEQCLGEPLDARSDVYGCGALFYELVTGAPPFVGDDAQGLLRQHLLVAPLPPTERCPELDPSVDAIATRALAKDPADRYATMHELRRALRELLATLGVAVPASLRTGRPPPAHARSTPTPRAPMISEIRPLAPRSEPPPSSRGSSAEREALASAAPFLAARDPVLDADKRALAAVLERGDVDEIAATVTRLLARSDAGAARALSLIDDASQLAPLAESLLAESVFPTPYIEGLLARAGVAGARALWAARIRRPATRERRLQFVGWLRAVGRPGDEIVRVALGQLAERAASPGQLDCIEDLLLALPRTLDAGLAAAVEPFVASPSARVRELASVAVARAG